MMTYTVEDLESLGIDASALLERFMGNAAFVTKMLDKFAASNPVRSLEEAVASGDERLIERAFHTVKGTSAGLGLMSLSHACALVVDEVRHGGSAENVQSLAQSAIRTAKDTCVRIESLS